MKTVEHIDFEEFNHINEVEKYKGSDLFMTSDQKHELADDEFYFDELIGMEVYSDKHEGEVIEVRDLPQGEMLVVGRGHKKQALIPFLKHFIKDVDKEKRIIYIHEVEGLL